MGRWFLSGLTMLAGMVMGACLESSALADTGEIHGVRFTREDIIVAPDGTSATATIRVLFPAGFGVTTSPSSRRQLAGLPAGTLPLDADLNPAGLVPLTPSGVGAATLFATHERLPITFETTLIVWNVDAGTFEIRRDNSRHVRADELDQLAAWQGDLVDPAAALHPSNDGALQLPAASAGETVIVRSDAEGRAVLDTVRIDLPPATFSPHFPPGSIITWTAPGVLVMTNGSVDAAQSVLPGALPVAFQYRSHCLTKPATPPETFTFAPDGEVWTFTVDGGLRADGTMDAAPLQWGARTGGPGTAFTHVAGDFNVAAALFAGHAVRGDALTGRPDDGPGTLLYSGLGRPGDPDHLERPGTAPYADGLANYPGLNFRVDTDGAQMAISRLGDPSGGPPGEAEIGPYPLRSISKYYVRPGGVSGRHAAETAAFATLAGNLSLHGFSVVLAGLDVAYLDNHPHDSAVGGTIAIPGVRGNPGFTLPFSNVSLLCDGQLGELTLAGPGSEQTLHYWRARFTPLTAEFLHQPPAAPTRHALLVGAEVSLPGVVREPLAGALGFMPAGRLVTAADGFPGVNSRLRRPSRVQLHGTRSALDPSKPGFTLHPVTDLCLNDSEDPDAPVPGFVSLAGTVDVPFFEDLRVHVLARATGGGTLIRGGWSDGGRTFFNDTRFDPANRGFPALFGDAFDLYANGASYDPRARKDWLGFVNFDLPLAWDAARRQFVSSRPEEKNFLVVQTQRVLQRLTPAGADLRFGAQFSGLPRLNLAALVIDEEEAIQELVNHLPDGPKIAAAARALDDLLSGRSDALVNSAVDAAVDAYLDTLFTPGGPLDGVTSAAAAGAALDGTATILRGELNDIVGPVEDTARVLGEIRVALDKLDAGLDAANVLLARDAQGRRGTFVTATIALGGPSGVQAANRIDALVNVELRDTLDQLQLAVTELKDAVARTRPFLNAAGGVADLLAQSLAVVNGGGLDLSSQAVAALRQYFAAAHDPNGLYLAELGESRVRDALKRIVRDQVHASGFVADLQSTLRDLLEPLRDDYQLAFERIHGVLNDVLRSAFSELQNELADAIGGPVATANQASGVFRDTLEVAKIDGTARIEGDTLVSAHLNATLGLRVPDKVSLSGWLDYRQYKSSQPVPACAAGLPDGRIEIALGAEGFAGLQGNPPIQAKLNGRYAMKSDGTPLAASGALDLAADLKFDAFTLRHAHFEFGFGERDNYLFAQGDGSVWFIRADVRAFLGRTCDRSLLERVDPDLGPVLAKAGLPDVSRTTPVAGAYWNADGTGSLNRFLGLPDKPITIEGTGGQGMFWFCNDAILDWRNPAGAKLVMGLRIRRGATIALGPVSAGADFRVLGAVDQLQLLRAADGLPEFRRTIVDQGGLITLAVAGGFRPTFRIGSPPAGYEFSKEFRFSARPAFTPVPPPGFFWANRLDFDP